MEKTLAHFRIAEKLGAGGMGAVYRAHDTRLERDVALKLLLPENFDDATARARLLREARAASALNHPNICVIYEVGEADGQVFIAMERIAGRPLSEMIPPGGLAPETVLRLGAQIADALAHAHERGIFHRDLKTSNVMVTPEGRVKVLDFGLARRAPTGTAGAGPSSGETLTQPGVVAGTPHSLAPELLRGAKADAGSDQWALGILLFEAASGGLPFQGRSGYELSAAILNHPPAPLPERVPAGLRAIIQRCLAKEPMLRYRSVGEVRAAIEALLSDAHLPIARPSRSAWQRVGIAAGVVALGVAAVLIIPPYLPRPPRPELVQRQLTSNPETNLVDGGTLSPDGKYLAFMDKLGCHIRLMETGDTRPISLPPGLSGNVGAPWVAWADWIPDGTRLLVSGTMSGGDPAIWSLPVVGGGGHLILKGGGHAVITPDGTHIAYVRSGARGLEIWCMDADGQSARRVVGTDSSGIIPGNIAWSPNGQRIVYSRWTGADHSQQRLETCDLAGKSRVFLPDSLARRLHGWTVVAWAPDGRIIFPAIGTGAGDHDVNLWTLHVNAATGVPSGKPEQITHWLRVSLVWPMAISPDGKRLTAYLAQYQSDCFIGEMAGARAPLKSVRRLTLDDKFDVYPCWLHDSRAILFASNRNGTFDLYRQALDQTTAEPVVVGPRDQFEPKLSPDGAWILYWSSTGVGSDNMTLMRSPIEGGGEETVLSAAASSSLRCASAPASLSLLCEAEHGQMVFRSLDPLKGRGGEVARLPLDISQPWDLSPDGKNLAVGTDSVGTIRIHTLEGGAERDVHLDQAVQPAYLVWAAKGDGWFVVTAPETGWMLLRVDSSGHCTRLIPPAPWMYGCAPSPDGRSLAFTRNTVQGNLWLLENF